MSKTISQLSQTTNATNVYVTGIDQTRAAGDQNVKIRASDLISSVGTFATTTSVSTEVSARTSADSALGQLDINSGSINGNNIALHTVGGDTITLSGTLPASATVVSGSIVGGNSLSLIRSDGTTIAVAGTIGVTSAAIWNAGTVSAIGLNIALTSGTLSVPGETITSLPAAAAISAADVFYVNQGGVDAQTTAALLSLFALEQILPSVSLSANTALTQIAHNRRSLFCSSSLTITASGLSDGFACDIINIGTGTVTFGSGITALSGVSTLAASSNASIRANASTVYALNGGSVAVSPTLCILSIVGVMPGGTSTATLLYANGAPTALTATANGSSFSTSAMSFSNTSGSGSSASGTITITFTTPASGSYSIILSGVGTYAATTLPYSFTTTTLPLINIVGVTPLGAGLTATASGNFANGDPTALSATVNGSALTISNTTITTTTGTGATASGTWSFTFTNPTAGTQGLIVTGTGTYAATSTSYSFITSTPSLTVNTVSPPGPLSPITIAGATISYSPTNLDYSTDGGTTWTTAPSPIISAGAYSFSISAGLAAGTWTVKVRDHTTTTIIATSAAFNIVAMTGSITAPGSSSTGTGAAFTVSVSAGTTGTTTVYASITSGGVEQTPRTAMAASATSVSLTPTVGAASTASLYAAPTGGSAFATSGSFTPVAPPSYAAAASPALGEGVVVTGVLSGPTSLISPSYVVTVTGGTTAVVEGATGVVG